MTSFNILRLEKSKLNSANSEISELHTQYDFLHMAVHKKLGTREGEGDALSLKHSNKVFMVIIKCG